MSWRTLERIDRTVLAVMVLAGLLALALSSPWLAGVPAVLAIVRLWLSPEIRRRAVEEYEAERRRSP
jgi:hypothetical protein